jgi:hypothetical protein
MLFFLNRFPDLLVVKTDGKLQGTTMRLTRLLAHLLFNGIGIHNFYLCQINII